MYIRDIMKQKLKTVFHLGALLGVCFVHAQTVTTRTMRVTADRVNVRARPDTASEAVGQVHYDDRIEVKAIEPEWVEIVPPAHLSLWVHQDFIENDEVRVAKLNVRAGAGINFNRVGYLRRGDRVVPLGAFGEWLKIAPPDICSLWISERYVEGIPPLRTNLFVEAEIPDRIEPPGLSPLLPEDPRIEPITNRVTTALLLQDQEEERSPPADFDLIPVEEQGRIVDREGFVAKTPFLIGRPARYRLVRYDGYRVIPICYLRGDDEQLRLLKNRRLRISGREYWTEGRKEPIVVIEKMTLLDAPVY